MSLVIQTYRNDLGLNLCIVPFTSYMVTISENSLTRSYKKRSKYIAINTGNKRSSSRGTNSVGVIICVRGISRHLEGENIGGFGGGLLEYETIGEFLTDITKEFGGEDEELVKVVELRAMLNLGEALIL